MSGGGHTAKTRNAIRREGAIPVDGFFRPERFECPVAEPVSVSAVFLRMRLSGSDSLGDNRGHEAIDTHSFILGLRGQL